MFCLDEGKRAQDLTIARAEDPAEAARTVFSLVKRRKKQLPHLNQQQMG
jgi:hypothetical protein